MSIFYDVPRIDKKFDGAMDVIVCIDPNHLTGRFEPLQLPDRHFHPKKNRGLELSLESDRDNIAIVVRPYEIENGEKKYCRENGYPIGTGINVEPETGKVKNAWFNAGTRSGEAITPIGLYVVADTILVLGHDDLLNANLLPCLESLPHQAFSKVEMSHHAATIRQATDEGVKGAEMAELLADAQVEAVARRLIPMAEREQHFRPLSASTRFGFEHRPAVG